MIFAPSFCGKHHFLFLLLQRKRRYCYALLGWFCFWSSCIVQIYTSPSHPLRDICPTDATGYTDQN